MVRDTFQDGRIRVHEEVVTSLDGKPINVLVHTAPVRGVEGEISGVIEMSANITKIANCNATHFHRPPDQLHLTRFKGADQRVGRRDLSG